MTHDQLGGMIRYAHAHGTILATEAHQTPYGEWWLIIYTHDAADGDGMAFADFGALRAWLGY